MKLLETINFCVPGMLSYCTAGDNRKDQKYCRFYSRSSMSDRCMHFREALGGHCDCLAAQMDIRGN